MAEGGRRRSARLLALEEKKNQKEAHVSMDFAQAIGDGKERMRKRGRKPKIDKIHEAELQNEAKLALECLKNNRTSCEQISQMNQTYFNTMEEVRKDSNLSALIKAVKPQGPQGSSQPMIHSDMNQSGMEINVAANGRILSSNQNSTIMRTSQARAISRPHYRKDSVECSNPSTEERRNTYQPGNDSSEPIVSMVYKQAVQLVYNNNGPSYKESLKNFVKNAGYQAEKAAERYFQEYAHREKAQSMPFHCTSYISSDTRSFFPQFGSCLSNPNFSIDGAAGIAARDMHFSPTTAMVSTITSGKPFPSVGTNEKFDFDLNEEPSCKLETDELLRTFSQIGNAEFLNRNRNILTSTANQIVVPNQSFSPFLNGERDCDMVTAIPSNTIASPMSHLGQYIRSEPTKGLSIYDILFLQPKSGDGDSNKLERKGLAGPKLNPNLVPNSSSSGYLSFREYTSSCPKMSKQKGLAVSEPSGHLAPTGSSSGNHGFSPHFSTSSTFEPRTLNLFK